MKTKNGMSKYPEFGKIPPLPKPPAPQDEYEKAICGKIPAPKVK